MIGGKDDHRIGAEVVLRHDLPTGAGLTVTDQDGHWTWAREAVAEKAKDAMTIRAEQHIFVTGACGAGKSTLGKALSRQLQLPLHRLDDDPDFRQMLQHEPDLNRFTDPHGQHSVGIS